MAAHGLPFDYIDTRFKWVKMQRVSRLHERHVMSEFDFKSLPNGNRRAILQYKDREQARWNVIKQRVRNRFERKNAFKVPPGVDPTKLVLRYFDSRPPPKESDKQNDAQNHGSGEM